MPVLVLSGFVQWSVEGCKRGNRLVEFAFGLFGGGLVVAGISPHAGREPPVEHLQQTALAVPATEIGKSMRRRHRTPSSVIQIVCPAPLSLGAPRLL